MDNTVYHEKVAVREEGDETILQMRRNHMIPSQYVTVNRKGHVKVWIFFKEKKID